MEEEWKLAEETEQNQKPDFILPNGVNKVVEVSEEDKDNDEFTALFGGESKK